MLVDGKNKDCCCVFLISICYSKTFVFSVEYNRVATVSLKRLKRFLIFIILHNSNSNHSDLCDIQSFSLRMHNLYFFSFSTNKSVGMFLIRTASSDAS